MFGAVRGADVTVKYGHFFSLLLTNIQKFNELKKIDSLSYEKSSRNCNIKILLKIITSHTSVGNACPVTVNLHYYLFSLRDWETVMFKNEGSINISMQTLIYTKS